MWRSAQFELVDVGVGSVERGAGMLRVVHGMRAGVALEAGVAWHVLATSANSCLWW